MAAVPLNSLQTRNRGNIVTPKAERSCESKNGEKLKKTWEELTSLILETDRAIILPQVRYQPSTKNI